MVTVSAEPSRIGLSTEQRVRRWVQNCTSCIITVITFAHEWQTIIAGAIALAAAWWTIRTIRRQIRLQESQIEDGKRRYADAQRSKMWAARAELPDALSALCGYSGRCVSYLIGADGFDQMPDTPADAISVVKSCVEFVDSDSAEKLSDLIVHYQNHNARLSGYRRTDSPTYNLACRPQRRRLPSPGDRQSEVPSTSRRGDLGHRRTPGPSPRVCKRFNFKATRGVTIAVVSSRERKRRQPGLATDDPAFVGWHQLVRGIQGS